MRHAPTVGPGASTAAQGEEETGKPTAGSGHSAVATQLAVGPRWRALAGER
jgi:hypothetical protein